MARLFSLLNVNFLPPIFELREYKYFLVNSFFVFDVFFHLSITAVGNMCNVALSISHTSALQICWFLEKLEMRFCQSQPKAPRPCGGHTPYCEVVGGTKNFTFSLFK